MITTILHRSNDGFAPLASLDEISDRIAEHGTLLWLDVEAPTPADFDLLQHEFGFHELAMEDVERAHQRPKLESYEAFHFAVFHGIQVQDGHTATREIGVFVGRNYLVSVHAEPLPELAEVARRWQSATGRLASSIEALFYSVVDSIVDGYFPAMDYIADRVADLEEAVINRPDPDTLRDVFVLKRDVVALRRMLAAERDVLGMLLRHDTTLLSRRGLVYFGDVHDNVLRVIDTIDTYQDLLSSALDLHASMSSNRLNQAMKTLTAMATVLVVPTIIASIYGMNFANMPELHWQYGYYASLALMVVLTLAILLLFRRARWL